MNDDQVLTIIRDHLTQARDSLPPASPGIPARQIIAASRRRRDRRWLAGTAGAAAVAGLAAALSFPSGSQLRPVHEHLADWSVDTSGNGTVTVTVHQLTHDAELQRALVQAGVPAIVTPRSCLQGTQNRHTDGGVRVSANPPGLIITPAQIPTGTRVIFSVIQVVIDGTRTTGFGWGLVKNGQPLHCTPPAT